MTFTDFTKDFIKFHFDLNPGTAIYLGDHSYDKKLKPVSKELVASDIASYKKKLDELNNFNRNDLSLPEKFDYDVINWIIESCLFELEKIKFHEKSPIFYIDIFGVITLFLNKNYAPLNQRLEALNALFEIVPDNFKAAESLLSKRINKIEYQYTLDSLTGIEKLIMTELPEIYNGKEVSEEVKAEFNNLSEIGLNSLNEYRDFLGSLECIDFGDEFRLGEKLFLKMLSVKEQVNYSLTELKSMGETELKRLQDELDSVKLENGITGLTSIDNTHPTEATLLDDTRETLRDLLDFVRRENIVSLPEDLNCIVTELPSYMNIGFAAMGTAGPYESTNESFYYVNPPKPHWEQKRKDEWLGLFNYPTLKLISIHEAFPGHYSHFVNAFKHAREIAKISMCYSYAEAWAHYSEEMMIQKGYGNGDASLKIAMLKEALIRCCRFIVAIGLHCEKMTVEEATEFFQNNAMMNYTTARQEAERGVYDPGYINYTLGKIILKEMKENHKLKDSRLTDTDFHNAFINFGCPTLKIAQDYFTTELGLQRVGGKGIE